MSLRQRARAQRAPAAAAEEAPPPPAPAGRQTRAATIITDDNISDLVEQYTHNRRRLPADLRETPIGDWDVSRVTNMYGLFFNEATFDEPLNDWNVSNVTNMSNMFEGATSFNQPLDRWNISRVNNMEYMFDGATSFSQNPNWNIGPNVRTNNMFRDTPLEGQAPRARQRRAPAAEEAPPPSAPAQRQTRARAAPPAQQTIITNANIRNLVLWYIDYHEFIPADLRNIPIGNWDVSRVTNMESLFFNKRTFNEPLNNWNVSNVTDMESMFNGATSFNQPLDRWDVSNVRNMRSMFKNTSLSQNPNWNIGPNVITTNMFQGTPLEGTQLATAAQPAPAEAPAPRARQTRRAPAAAAEEAPPPAPAGRQTRARVAPAARQTTIITDDNINDLVSKYLRNRNRLPADLREIPIGDWDVSRVTDMHYLFYGARNFNEPLNNWNVSNVRDMTSMFSGATSFSQNPNWNIGPNVITSNMFRDTPIERAQAAPAVRPPPQEPGGVAFEIHNAFDSFKLNDFMAIIESKSYFINRDRPLQPLIDNINANPANSAEVKRDLTSKITRIFTTLREYGGYETNKDKIIKCIQYVLIQPQEFIDIYIQTLITDCLRAYSTGRQESCVKGVYERIFYSFRDTIATICLDQMQGTGAAPLCKPEYLQLYEFFYKAWPKEGPGGLNEMMQEWYGDGEAVSALSPEERKESFVNFVRNKINNAARFRAAELSIRKYANEDLNAMFGGKRSNSRQRRSNSRKLRKTVKKRLNKRNNSRKLKTRRY